uniref:Uncharacterized protein n=1 Tax=Wuchereria bancrofti TaxID=6293 RepID=A0AAF5Q6X1_WUCBA
MANAIPSNTTRPQTKRTQRTTRRLSWCAQEQYPEDVGLWRASPTAQLKMSNGHIWERPLNHLYPLELSISQNKQYQVVDPNIELEDDEDEEKLSIRPRFGEKKKRCEKS